MFFEVLSNLSRIFVPFLLLFIPIIAYLRRIPLMTVFVEGAEQAFPMVLSLLPHLVAMMVAIAVFRESGALTLLVDFFVPLLEFVSIPKEVFPLGFLRSLSGTGSLAFVEDLLRHHGPDSFIGNLASTIQGSTDTTLYILAVYFGSIGIRKARYALIVGLLADTVGFLASVLICHRWFC
ncbi:spore maturation protein [Pasteuria penetrans]|uniref:spore maturation protein n=1 Tax=Pasteuria penetrans TaxID=86005 RepID=UPI000FC1487F|nr:nucleoside recognition domain-containing protein [Pasteuria penetrans]